MYSTQPCPVYWKVALRRPLCLGMNYISSDKNCLQYRLALDKGHQFYFTLFDFLDSLNCKMIFIDDYNQKYPLYVYEICHDVENQFWLVNRNSLWSMDVAKIVSKKELFDATWQPPKRECIMQKMEEPVLFSTLSPCDSSYQQQLYWNGGKRESRRDELYWSRSLKGISLLALISQTQKPQRKQGEARESDTHTLAIHDRLCPLLKVLD